MTFIRWLGRLAAGAAVILAIVWLVQARPNAQQQTLDMQYHRCMQERAFRTSEPVLSHRSFQIAPECLQARPDGWDESLVLRAFMALAVAVAILMIVVMLPRKRA